MSDATASAGRPAGGAQGSAPIIGALLLGLAVLAMLGLSGGLAPLHRSAIGFEGLVVWLKHNGLEARGFGGGGVLTTENVGLRVLPLFHPDPDSRPSGPEGEQPPPAPPDQIVPVDVIREKIELLPTLLILPKWHPAILQKGLAHPLLLHPEDQVTDLLRRIDPSAGTVARPERGYVEHSVTLGQDSFTAGLYYPQSVTGGDCVPLLGERDAMLFGECDLDGFVYYLLADPDLMSAHGLRLAENARITVAVTRELAGDAPVIVDRTRSIFAVGVPGREARARSWSDLARFFAYPFSLIWAGFAVVGLLVLWRAWVRYGPALRPFDDGLGASKDVSIAATARLLRTAGYDAKLLDTYVATRCQALAAELLGPHRPAGADPRALVVAAAGRKSPELAGALEATTREAASLDPATALSDLLDLLDRFEGLCQRILHEFGRTPGARGRDPG